LKCFITGVNGLIGSFVARKFLNEGYQVIALQRKNSDLSSLHDIAAQIEWVEGDILDIPALEACVQKADYVIHCAAIVSFSPKDRERMYQVNVEGTANIVNVCLAYPPQKLCFLSSIAALGRKKEITRIDENMEWVDSDENSDYAKSKYLAEMEIWRGNAEGLATVILNPSVVLGVGDWRKSSTQIFHYVWKESLFYTKGSLNYVDVRDVAEITYRLTTASTKGERFIVSAGNCAYEAIFAQIATHFQKRKPPYLLQNWQIEIGWRILAWFSFFTGAKPLITRETAKIAQRNYFYQNDKLKKELNFEFRTLEETLQWACEALKQKYLK
jgi:nucleoside-diphosphate-sugar epimerase